MTNLKVEREWITEAGLVAKVIAYPDEGHRCGYVAVPIHSILFGEDYDHCCADNVSQIEVHGGISYAGKDSFLNTNDNELFWWFGFDCAHGYDGYDFEIMSNEKRKKMESGIEVIPCRLFRNFRGLDFCEKECENFAFGLVDFERKKIERADLVDALSAKQQNAPTSPSHYKQGGIECIDAIRAMTSSMHGDGFKIACLKDVLKYVWRHEHKSGLEDLKKAQVYLKWAIEQMENKK